MKRPTTGPVGVIADTHGLLRPEAMAALQGCRLILHAGDVGTAEVLQGLLEIAPVVAVRGNVDHGAWAQTLPESQTVTVGRFRLHVLHDRAQLAAEDLESGLHAVISGHSHRPCTEVRNGVLFLNPGSAGPRRFRLPISLALLYPGPRRLRPHLIELLAG